MFLELVLNDRWSTFFKSIKGQQMATGCLEWMSENLTLLHRNDLWLNPELDVTSSVRKSNCNCCSVSICLIYNLYDMCIRGGTKKLEQPC